MSLSLVAVFIPLLFMGGLVGRLFREFAVTLSVAVAVSLVVSLTTTPMLCARFLRRRAGTSGTGRLAARSPIGVFDRLLRAYDASLGWALDYRGMTLAILLATIALSAYLFVIVPKGFFPQQDNGLLIGNIQASQGISFQAMREILAKDVQVLRRDPAIEHGRGLQRRRHDDQPGAALHLAHASRAAAGLAPMRSSRACARGSRTTRGRACSCRRRRTSALAGGGERAVSVHAARRTTSRRSTTGRRASPLACSRSRSLADVNLDQQNQRPRGRRSTIDRDTAARLGVGVADIDQALYDAFGQRQVSTMYAGLNQYRVVMEVAPEYWQHPETLAAVYVASASGHARSALGGRARSGDRPRRSPSTISHSFPR